MRFSVIEDIAGCVCIFLLALLPLVLKLLSALHIPVINSDGAQMNLVFIFACIAGAVTWRSDQHISLASLTDKLNEKSRLLVLRIRAAAVPAILTALFFAAFSESFSAFMPDQKIWGIPLRLVFACLPLAYFSMLFRAVKHSEHIIASCVGLAAGLFISAGPIIGVLFYSAGWENIPWLNAVNNCWLSLSEAAFVPLIVLLILLGLLGVPLFIVIGGIAYAAFSQGGGYVEMVPLESYTILTDKSIAAIPLFTVAGFILSRGSAGARLVAVFRSLFGWFRGGTVIAAVVVVTFFTTFTGVSGVTILALGTLLTAALCGSGYKRENAESLITASGALGLLFPPSVAIIMFGTTNYFSVDIFDVFKGAVIPGTLLALSMIILGVVRDKLSDRPSFSPKQIALSVRDGFFELLMPALIMLFYFNGAFSLMETAAFAFVYAYILETFLRRDFSVKQAFKVIAEAVPVTGGVLFILASARGLSSYLVDANVPQYFTEFVSTFIHSKYLFLLLMNIFLIAAGCVMDIYSAILIISPLLMPVAESFGIHPVHTAVVFLMNMQLGFLTPPVGMDLFIASYTFDTPVMKIVKNIVPFLLVQAAVLLLVTYIPWFTEVLL